jgi:hypothetical protein
MRRLLLVLLLATTGCTLYKPTVAGTTVRKGINNVGIKPPENRHF